MLTIQFQFFYVSVSWDCPKKQGQELSGDVGEGEALLWVGITSSWLYSGSVTMKSRESLHAKEICLGSGNNSFISWFYSVFKFIFSKYWVEMTSVVA